MNFDFHTSFKKVVVKHFCTHNLNKERRIPRSTQPSEKGFEKSLVNELLSNSFYDGGFDEEILEVATEVDKSTRSFWTVVMI